MHPADIKAQISKAGSSQTVIANTVQGRKGGKVTPGAVWLVVQGTMSSANIARRISEVTGLPVCQLWPGRYPALEAEQRKPRSKRAAHTPIGGRA